MAKKKSKSGKRAGSAGVKAKKQSYKQTGKTTPGITIDFSPAEALEKMPRRRKR
ncbi:MAG TPA: hypothetical protein VGK99_18005 [Acidobacteriota bacterium]|jgi:hypothetical protein